jgi:outer membrane protein TolC
MKKPAIIFSILLYSLLSQAQNQRYISSNEAVERAVKNNQNVKIANLDADVANANYHQTDAIFLPQITVSYTAMSTNNPLNAFGFLLQQESVTAMDFDPAVLNNPGSRQNYNTQAEAKLPLLNLDMLYARRGAKN